MTHVCKVYPALACHLRSCRRFASIRSDGYDAQDESRIHPATHQANTGEFMKRKSARESRSSTVTRHLSRRVNDSALPHDGVSGDVPVANTRRRRNLGAQRGVAAVEFAIVLPLLLLIIFSTAEFGVALYDKAMITNASREGARAGVVLRNPKPSKQDVTNVVLAYCQNYLITFGSSNTPTVSVPSGIGGTFGTPLTVTVSYQYAGLGLGAMLSAFTGPIVMTATTIMNNE